MKISSNGQHRWSLSFSQELAKEVDSTIANISNKPRRDMANAAWKAAVAKILADPLTAGGPRFRYHKMGLTTALQNSFALVHF